MCMQCTFDNVTFTGNMFVDEINGFIRQILKKQKARPQTYSATNIHQPQEGSNEIKHMIRRLCATEKASIQPKCSDRKDRKSAVLVVMAVVLVIRLLQLQLQPSNEAANEFICNCTWILLNARCRCHALDTLCPVLTLEKTEKEGRERERKGKTLKRMPT